MCPVKTSTTKSCKENKNVIWWSVYRWNENCNGKLCMQMYMHGWCCQWIMKTSHRVAFGPTNYLSIVQPLRSKNLVESPQRKLALLENPGEPACCKTTQVLLEPQIMLLLRSELPLPKDTNHRPTAAPLLGMSWWTRNAAAFVWCLTPAQLWREMGWPSKVFSMSQIN